MRSTGANTNVAANLQRPRSRDTETLSEPTLLLRFWRATRSRGLLVLFPFRLSTHFIFLALLPRLYDDHDIRTSGSILIISRGPFFTSHIITANLFFLIRHIASDITTSEWKRFPSSCLRRCRGRGICLLCSRRPSCSQPLRPTTAAALPGFIRHSCKTVLCLNMRFLDEPPPGHCEPSGALFWTL